MNILALDTSMGACSAAVLRSDDAKPKLFARQKLMERGLGHRLGHHRHQRLGMAARHQRLARKQAARPAPLA